MNQVQKQSKLTKRLYDASKIDWDHLTFSTKELWMLMIPVIVEQFLNSLMGMADTMMVSHVGSAAMSAVSLVDSINVLVIQVFAALATGAAIICSQYLGKGDTDGANRAARQIFLTVLVISVGLMAICLIFDEPLLRLVFGKVEPAVMDNSVTYFVITVISYPFIALFNAGAAFYRSRQEAMNLECDECYRKCGPDLWMQYGRGGSRNLDARFACVLCGCDSGVSCERGAASDRPQSLFFDPAGLPADRDGSRDRYSVRY